MCQNNVPDIDLVFVFIQRRSDARSQVTILRCSSTFGLFNNIASVAVKTIEMSRVLEAPALPEHGTRSFEEGERVPPCLGGKGPLSGTPLNKMKDRC